MTASKTIWVGSPVLSSCFFLSFSPEFRSLLFRWYKTFYSLPDCLASLDCLVGFYVHFIRCLSSSTGHHRFSVIFAHTHTHTHNMCNKFSLARKTRKKQNKNKFQLSRSGDQQPNPLFSSSFFFFPHFFLFGCRLSNLTAQIDLTGFWRATKPTPPRVAG